MCLSEQTLGGRWPLHCVEFYGNIHNNITLLVEIMYIFRIFILFFVNFLHVRIFSLVFCL